MNKTKNQHINKNNIFYTKKNIFDVCLSIIKSKELGSSIVIPHVCNNINVFGAGFAAAISKEFPEVKDNYHLLGKNQKLGHVQYISVKKDKDYGHEIIVANMIAQNGIRSPKNPRPLNYFALGYCMKNISSFIQNKKHNDNTISFQIHCPKFGSGLAGGNWNFVQNLIEDVWTNEKITVYQY